MGSLQAELALRLRSAASLRRVDESLPTLPGGRIRRGFLGGSDPAARRGPPKMPGDARWNGSTDASDGADGLNPGRVGGVGRPARSLALRLSLPLLLLACLGAACGRISAVVPPPTPPSLTPPSWTPSATATATPTSTPTPTPT